MNLKCDKCNEEFILDDKDIKCKSLDDVLINVTYFECSNCNEKYIVSCEDKYILKEQRRYKKLKESNDNAKAIKCLNNMKLHSDRLKLKVINLL